MMQRAPRVGDILSAMHFSYRVKESYVDPEDCGKLSSNADIYSVGYCDKAKNGTLQPNMLFDARFVKNRSKAAYRVVSVRRESGGADGHSPKQSLPDGKIVTAVQVAEDLSQPLLRKLRAEFIRFNLNNGFYNTITPEDLTLLGRAVGKNPIR